MNLTEEQMIEIIKNKKINECSENEKKTSYDFCFRRGLHGIQKRKILGEGHNGGK